MSNIYLPIYDPVRSVIRNMLNNGNDWEQIEGKYENLNTLGALPETVNEEIWKAIVMDLKEEYHKPENIEKIKQETSIISVGEDNGTFVPDDPRSSWQLYKQKLLESGWRREGVENLEKNTISILKKLNKNTVDTGPVKGLVIGQVQSGKTSSMAGLMAMAADWGWNTFVVLSGMVENLRVQTEKRLITDLNNNGNCTWIPLPKLSRRSPAGQRLQDLNLEDDATQRYLTVCLKNKTRLENLISWMKADKNKLKQMKILIIDDEADQASVNTKNLDGDERAKINELIIELTEIDKDSGVRPLSVNYISYTATPYSNFLNESLPESLYPKDFIGVLPVSNEYFGPKQIFGLAESNDYNGLDIVREISEDDITDIKELQEGKKSNIPRSLQNSICWFLCATATMRYYKIKKPFSMLVHTSQKQMHHKFVAEAIYRWIKNTKIDRILNLCNTIYKEETSKFTKEKFREGFKDYPVSNEEINDYPDFKDLRPYIEKLTNEISNIMMDEEGELNYHDGIHLCIDNSAHTGITEENLHIRLAYPTKQQLEALKEAPAFIIVGGSTLSRGLTIEGLVSTYFLRAANAADSLMQMGRWFGYRRGYELFPRIWMSKSTYDKFCFLTELEQELKEELEEFSIGQKSPVDYGPRVKNTPKVSWLRITAKNKMQSAVEVEMDFTGASVQTIHFENDPKVLRKNISVTENFLFKECGEPKKSLAKNAIYYNNVPFSKVKRYLSDMEFNARSRVFNQIDSFCQWFEEVKDDIGFSNWNVIVAGSGDVSEHGDNKWFIEQYNVGKVERSAKIMNYSNDVVNIGVLRGPHDVFADINDEEFHNAEKKEIKSVSNRKIKEVRNKYGLGNVPQLILYRIDRKSKARDTGDRIDLNFDEDIIGVYINIPGDTGNRPHAKGLTVRLEDNDSDD